MKGVDVRSRLEELYLPPTEEFTLVDVPDMKFVMIDGHGAEDRTALDQAVKWLFAAVHPAKRVARERMGANFAEPPLEGLWWADDVQDFICGNRDALKWRMMIVFEPEWLTAEILDEGITAARTRLGEPPASLRLETYREGLSAQITHIGPPESEGPVIDRLHKEFLPARNLVPNGCHHEIYLTDPKRAAPQKMRTVLRQPVQRAT